MHLCTVSAPMIRGWNSRLGSSLPEAKYRVLPRKRGPSTKVYLEPQWHVVAGIKVAKMNGMCSEVQHLLEPSRRQNHRSRSELRSAMTIVELLVAISIITILLSLALMGVQAVRESARRLQCQNNLRQQLVALQSHHSTHKALPSLYNGTVKKYPLQEWDLFHMHSWRVPLLPYLEQTQLHARIDFDAFATSPENLPVGQTVIPTFICPSGGDAGDMGWGTKHGSLGVANFPNVPEQHRYHVVRSDYDAMAGIQEFPDPLPNGFDSNSVDHVHWGIWGWPIFNPQSITGNSLNRYRQGKFRDVSDGLSNTLALVERAGKPIDLLDGKPNITPGNPEAVYPGQSGWSASNTFIWSLNMDSIGVNKSNSTGIFSFHSGGANVALADGSVRFLDESLDFQTLVKLFGRSDGGIPEN